MRKFFLHISKISSIFAQKIRSREIEVNHQNEEKYATSRRQNAEFFGR